MPWNSNNYRADSIKLRLKNQINCGLNLFVSESRMGWFGDRRRAFSVTGRAMALFLKNILIYLMHENSVPTSQRTVCLLRRDQNLVLSMETHKHIVRATCTDTTPLAGTYSYHQAVRVAHFVRFHPKSTNKPTVLTVCQTLVPLLHAVQKLQLTPTSKPPR
jgi:hypothetical protein